MICCEIEKDEYIIVYLYLQGSDEFFEKLCFLDNDLIGLVFGDMLFVFCLKYRMIIIIIFLIFGIWLFIWILMFYGIRFI